MNKRIQNKKRTPFFVGRHSTLGMTFWPHDLKRNTKLLEDGIVRHSKKRDRIEKKVRKLQSSILEHKTYRERGKEINRRLAVILHEEGEEVMLNKIKEVHEQVNKKWGIS